MFHIRRLILNRTGNPVLALELSKSHRSKAYNAIESIIAAFAFLCLVISGVHFFWASGLSDEWMMWMFFLSMVLVWIVLPALTATSIVDERRHQTLVPVQLSLLRPFDIVWGKVVASIAPVLVPAGVSGFVYVLLLLFFMKLQGYWFAVAVAFAVVGLAVTVAVAFMVSAVSVLVSTFAKSSAASIIVSYIIAYVLAFLMSILLVFIPLKFLTERCGSNYSRSWVCQASLLETDPLVAYVGVVTTILSAVVVFACVTGVSVWWACRRLRLPAKK